MGKFLTKYKQGKNITINTSKNIGNKVQNFAEKRINQEKRWKDGKFHDKEKREYNNGLDDFDNPFIDDFDGFRDPYDVAVQPAQKPASFHHFVLENKYQDLEKSIRGYKDVYNKEKQTWEVKRKEIHCFTDEESEDILRTAQSHLSTDIKLSRYDKETFGIRFLAIYDVLEHLFKRIMEYRFGRFKPELQGQMKDQAIKIFVELITRIEANYLRALGGAENIATHDSVRSQESLQGENGIDINRRYT